MADKPKADLSVVVARFQTHRLTPAHESILSYACQHSDKVLVLLGCSNTITKRNPLTFPVRQHMVFENLKKFKGGGWAPKQVSIVPLLDHPDNATWASQVDGIVSAVAGGGSVRFIWGSDGAQTIYKEHGRYLDHFVMGPMPGHATEIRANLKPELGIGSEAFRAGAIWQQERLFVNPWPTVDMVVTQNNSILLGQKDTDGDKWRFPGGFVDVGDLSLEAAARRELSEEIGPDVSVDPVYIGSTKIQDWRLRGCQEGIMTAIFHCPVQWGNAKAGDDLKRVEWFPYYRVADVIHDVHRPIWNMFDLWVQSTKPPVPRKAKR